MRILNPNINRRGHYRHQNKTVLIITNGKQTEKVYFKNFKKAHSHITVKVRCDGGSDPITLVKYTMSIKDNYDVDKIYCVYDANSTSEDELIKANEMASKNGINTCISNPCFELWFLLHFKYTTSPLSRYVDVKKELLNYMPNYKKKSDNVFHQLLPNQPDAIIHAKKLRAYHTASGNVSITSRNPSTQVHELVEYLNMSF